MDFTKTTLGIEFGSTRVKAVLIDQSFRVIAEGVHDWENSFDGGYWTYAHDEILTALQQSFAALSKQVGDRYGVDNKKAASILDTFSCFVQGLIPYGAQMLMAAGLAALNPVSIIPHLYYPFAIGIAAILSILLRYPKRYS